MGIYLHMVTSFVVSCWSKGVGQIKWIDVFNNGLIRVETRNDLMPLVMAYSGVCSNREIGCKYALPRNVLALNWTRSLTLYLNGAFDGFYCISKWDSKLWMCSVWSAIHKLEYYLWDSNWLLQKYAGNQAWSMTRYIFE